MIDKKIAEHFRKKDPVLAGVLDKHSKLRILSKSDNYFSTLCEIIINQQLSDKAAATILGKFKKLFSGRKITPENLLKIKDQDIRNSGLSWKKVSFIKNIAAKIIAGDLNLDKLELLNDESVILELKKCKGIGDWTAEMFLMLAMGREDVFSHGDLGLRRAMQKLYGLKNEPTLDIALRISRKWSPYRTYASFILWRSLD